MARNATMSLPTIVYDYYFNYRTRKSRKRIFSNSTQSRVSGPRLLPEKEKLSALRIKEEGSFFDFRKSSFREKNYLGQAADFYE